MSPSRIAAVTGGNKGIGFAIVRQLALQYPKSPLNSGPLLLYLTARDQSRGEEALRQIQNDPQLLKAKALQKDGGLTEIKYHPLDISKSESIKDFASFLKKQHPDGVDIIINNASIAMDGFNTQIVEQTLQCNYYGALEANEAFIPVMRSGGRIVNMSSIIGSVSKYPAALADRFRNAKATSDVTKLMEEFKSAVAAGNENAQGWPSAAYAVSKAGTTGFTRVIAHDEQAKAKSLLINACCPGWVKTDMTKGRGVKTPDQGAQTPVKLALEDIGGKTGLYWRDEQVQNW